MKGSFEKLIQRACEGTTRTLAVAVAQDAEVLTAVRRAADLNMVRPLLIGDEAEIIRIAQEHSINISDFSIIDEKDKAAACMKAVALTSSGKAQVLMKGIVDTSVILHAALDRDCGLRDAPLLSHATVFELDSLNRLLFMTDGAMNIAPDVEQKQAIMLNSTRMTRVFGINNPIIACICAIEKVNRKMQCTLDAEELRRRCEAGEFTGCRVIGPVAMDNAVSVEAAKHKGIKDPLAGLADVVLMPNIESGNVLYKSLMYLAGARSASAVLGAKAPIVITSRADTDETKLNSIALAALMSDCIRSEEI